MAEQHERRLRAGRWLAGHIWLALPVSLAVGVATTLWTARLADTRLRSGVLTDARMTAKAVNWRLITTLSGSKADLASPDYQRLKEQLTLVRSAKPQCRFVYLLGQRSDGELFFFVDSEPPESKDYSPPGQVYDEASADDRQVFASGQEATTGPSSDRWGTWISGMVPVTEPQSGKIVAVLGMDFDARAWRSEVRSQCLPPVTVTLLVAALVSAFLYVQRRTERENRRLAESEAAFRESEERYHTLVESVPIGLYRCTVPPEGRLVMANSALARLLGFDSVEQLLGLPLASLYDDPNEIEALARALSSSGLIDEREAVMKRKDGTRLWTSLTGRAIRDRAGRLMYFDGSVLDVTKRMRAEEELRRAARTDRLTGLPNRAHLTDRLQQAILGAKRLKDHHFAVLFLDIDRFKIINDSLGHEVGDLLLQQVSLRLREAVRSGDLLSRGGGHEHVSARLGGDEFVVLLDGIRQTDDARLVAARILGALSETFHLQGRDAVISASIGIVTSDVAADRADDVLSDADTAMYEAKFAGKGRYVVFDASMRERVQDRLSLENDLRKAVGTDQFSLAYQPIVSLATGAIEGLEALLRWDHPKRGPVPPARFVPIAEDIGLIVAIGDWVLREACGQFAQWRRVLGDRAPRSISLNLSRSQLALPDLPARVSRVMADCGVEPSSLHLEITESMVMLNPEAGAKAMSELKRLGVKLALDDFGTGYSSLACLHQFPLDVLKIDRSFVANMTHGKGISSLIHSVTALAQTLGIAVVAEGVETPEQAAALANLGCRLAQGFLFGKPMSAAEVPAFRVNAGVLHSREPRQAPLSPSDRPPAFFPADTPASVP